MSDSLMISQPSATFCAMPWIGGMINPMGQFRACCIQNESSIDPSSNIKEHTVEDVRRLPFWNEVRRSMLLGERHHSCQACWQLEDMGVTSSRQSRADEWQIIADRFGGIQPNQDGTLSARDKIHFWDIRETNLCNMKCVMCGPAYSSLWNAESILHPNVIVPPMTNDDKLSPVIDAGRISKQDLFQTIVDDIDQIDTFYFAGGEPLISPIHWRIIDLLVERQAWHVRLIYNTNISKLTYHGRDIIEAWRKFDHVNVCCSIDAIGPRAEYVRFGTIWSNIDANWRRLKKELPASASISITTSSLTIGGLKQLLDWTKEFDFFPGQLSCNNVVWGPTWASMQILPDDLKLRLWDDLRPTILDTLDQRSYDALESCLFSKLSESEEADAHHHFAWFITGFDKIRQRRMTDVCPELKDFYESILDAKK